MITHKTTTITPALAEEMLARNTGNFRKVIPDRVRKYSASMLSNEWEENGETIKLAYDGLVLDGQHRLLAIVKSGVTIRCIVVSGLPHESAKTMDGGKPRALSDWVRHSGQKNAAAITAIGRMVMYYRAGIWTRQGFSSSDVSDAAVLEFIAANDEILQGSHRLACLCHRMIHPSSLGAIILIAADGRNPADNEMCVWFCEALAKGVNLGADEPVLHLRNKLNVQTHKREANYVQRMLACLAWNRTVRGETCRMLKFAMVGPNASRPIDTIELAPWSE